MTAAANDTWIENSLARLESLEAEREHLAATGQTARLAEIDEEIKGLYEALESVAGDDDSDDEPANEAVAAPIAAAPMAAPMMAMAAPMAAVDSPQPAMGMSPPPADFSTTSYDDVDIKPPRSMLPVVLGGLLVVGGGIGVFLMMNKDKPEEAKPAPTEPATVIKAGAIVDDTSEPNVAKGGDADRTRGTVFKEGRNNDSQPAKVSRGGSRPAGNRTEKKSDDGRKVTFEKGKDPLGGVD